MKEEKFISLMIRNTSESQDLYFRHFTLITTTPTYFPGRDPTFTFGSPSRENNHVGRW